MGHIFPREYILHESFRHHTAKSESGGEARQHFSRLNERIRIYCVSFGYDESDHPKDFFARFFMSFAKILHGDSYL